MNGVSIVYTPYRGMQGAPPMPEKYPPSLMAGYQIAKREVDGAIVYYLQEQQRDGTWRDLKGPYRQSNSAKAWLARRRLREFMSGEGEQS